MIQTAILLLALLKKATAHPLIKRDEYAIPETVIILLIMLGAGICVCVGYAINATFGFREDGNGMKPMTPEQQEYMAQVRVTNMNGLMAEGARSHRGGLRRGDVVYD